VRDEEVDDFYAWAASFLGAFRPLSSFIRVLAWNVFRAVYQRPPIVDLPIGPLIGAVLGETMVNATSRGFLDALPTTAFESTYFAAVMRALAFGPNPLLLKLVENGWHDTRELTEQPARRIPRSSLSKISLVVARLMADNVLFSENLSGFDKSTDRLVSACRELQFEGRISATLWRKITRESLQRSPLEDFASFPKERRVEVFEAALQLLMPAEEGEPFAEFVVGYLAQLVSGGSLEHAHLILPIQERFPAAMVWYGICAGLTPGNRLQSENGHLGLKIQRRLLNATNLLGNPVCDIAYDEFKVLMRGARSGIVRQSHSSTLNVEIAPTINTLVRWPSRQSEQQRLLLDEEKRAVGIPDRLMELVKTLRDGLDIAESMIGKDNIGMSHKGKRRPLR
jgi:hypothetical protein